jgi:hypothetical protein
VLNWTPTATPNVCIWLRTERLETPTHLHTGRLEADHVMCVEDAWANRICLYEEVQYDVYNLLEINIQSNGTTSNLIIWPSPRWFAFQLGCPSKSKFDGKFAGKFDDSSRLFCFSDDFHVGINIQPPNYRLDTPPSLSLIQKS